MLFKIFPNSLIEIKQTTNIAYYVFWIADYYSKRLQDAKYQGNLLIYSICAFMAARVSSTISYKLNLNPCEIQRPAGEQRASNFSSSHQFCILVARGRASLTLKRLSPPRSSVTEGAPTPCGGN